METKPDNFVSQSSISSSMSSHKRKEAPLFITAPARPRHLRPVSQGRPVATTEDRKEDSGAMSAASRPECGRVEHQNPQELGYRSASRREAELLLANPEPLLQPLPAFIEPPLSTSPSLRLALPSLMITGPDERLQPPATHAASSSEYSSPCDSPLKTATSMDFACCGPPTPVARPSSRKPRGRSLSIKISYQSRCDGFDLL